MNPYTLLAGLLVAAVVFAGACWKSYVVGKNEVRSEWQDEKIQQERAAEEDRLAHQGAITHIDLAAAAVNAAARKTDQQIAAKVPENVPSTLPMLPGSFRVLHDAAALGKEIDNTSRLNAPAVAPQDVARTIADNYAEARYNQRRLTELQDVVRASGCFDIPRE